MEEQIKILFEEMKQELQKQVTIMTENVTKTISATMDEKLKPLVEENKALKQEITTLKNKVQILEKQSRRNNIILHGIAETEKNITELMELVVENLNKNKAKLENFDKWEISRVQRLGNKNDKNMRPILISLTLAWRKIELLTNNKMFPENVYITEDFPKDVLVRRNELKAKLKEEINKGKIAYIRYDKLIVKNKISEKRKRAPSTSPKNIDADKIDIQEKTTPVAKFSKVDAFEKMRKRSTSTTERHNN